MQKVLGPVTLSESAGTVSIEISGSVDPGGGAVEGIVSASGSGTATLKAGMLLDVELVALEAKYPAIAPEIAIFKGVVDAAVAKL